MEPLCSLMSGDVLTYVAVATTISLGAFSGIDPTSSTHAAWIDQEQQLVHRGKLGDGKADEEGLKLMRSSEATSPFPLAALKGKQAFEFICKIYLFRSPIFSVKILNWVFLLQSIFLFDEYCN